MDAGRRALTKQNGARLVIINRETTKFDEMADLVARGHWNCTLSFHRPLIRKMCTAFHLF
jgi:hypothetical protein